RPLPGGGAGAGRGGGHSEPAAGEPEARREAAQPGAGGAGGDADPVVGDGHGVLVDLDAGGGGAGVADDVRDPFTDDIAEQLGEVVGQRRQGGGDLRVDADGGEDGAGGGDLARGADRLHVGRGRAHIREGLADGRLDLLELVPGCVRIGVDEAPGELGGDRQRGERVAHEVVEVPPDPLPL